MKGRGGNATTRTGQGMKMPTKKMPMKRMPKMPMKGMKKSKGY